MADDSVKQDGVRTGKASEPVDLPPYHTAETYTIAQQREAELAKSDGKAK
jgi:hypothetical protein